MTIIILKGMNEYIASLKQEQCVIQKKISENKIFLIPVPEIPIIIWCIIKLITVLSQVPGTVSKPLTFLQW